MTLQMLLSRVASSGIKLWLDGEQLAVRAPKGTLTPELRLALAEHKEELMALLRRQAARALKSPIPRGPESAAVPAPLSSGQERLWFLNRLVPDSPLYNLSVRLLIKGALDREALAQAFSALNARHEALRTTFPELEGRPHSVVAPASGFDLPSVDLTLLSPEESQRELARLSRANRLEPFVLSSRSLLRVLLVSLKKEEHVLLVTQHHIITDAWSVGVLFTELGQLYRAFAANKTPVLPELPIRYADYARWQQAALRGDAAQQSRAWWKEKLAGLPRLELPTSRACPASPTHAGDSRAIAVSPWLTARLKELSLREGCTLFVTLLSAWVILLHRYSSQDDFAVGTMTAGRDRSEVQGLLGFFVNTLVLRCDTSGAPTVSALLHRLREVAAAALEHDGVPFDEVVKATGATRGLGLNPLIQAVFLFENLAAPDAEIPAMTWTPQASKPDASVEGVTKCDLVLLFMEQNGGLAGSIDYATDLFDAATIERMVGHLQVLLHAIVEDPQAPISKQPMLTAEERQQLMAWNQTTTHDPQDRCLHELFEAQAARSPQAVALCCEQQQLTYQELNERANQLAHHLRSLGVGSEDRVGLCVERSAEVVIGILGILKAGGAYVPLDPMYPKERLAFMLEDSRAKALLTQRWLMAALPDHPVHRLYLDTDWEAIAKEQTSNLTSGAEPENRAYVIYTSGSTGRPKGVEVSHANVARLLAATQDWFHFDARDVWTLFHSYSFDFSVWEIWGALLFGGRLVVVPVEVSRAPEEFHRLLCRERVTVLNQTPSAFRMLVTADESAAPELGPALRLVIFGGEAVDLQSLRPWFQRHGDRRPQLVNMYGITETTVHVTYRRLSQGDLDGESASPIGRPIPDLQVYVLDGNQQLLPIGVPGELYVGEIGRASCRERVSSPV